MASILYNTDAFCHFFILDDNVSRFKKLQIDDLKSKFNNFDITWIDLDDKKRNFILETFISKSKSNVYTKNIANYSRFFMPDLLPDIKRALYMDTDIVVYGDIQELFNYNLDNFIIGAVPDSGIISDPQKQKMVDKYIVPEHTYFNAGILLIDCDKWRKNNICKKIAESDEQIADKKLFNSQDPINKCFECDYKILPHKFNWFGKFPTDTDNKTDLVIKHFAGKKPDISPQRYDISTIGDFKFFADMTPFYNEFKLIGIKQEHRNKLHQIKKVKLFGFIPFIKIIGQDVYLFNFIKILKVIK
jgi:lipopolysaccharide biosynthesis glycosyltransferase